MTLDGRLVLCGNKDIVFGRNGIRRSEAAISKKCLDLQKGTADADTELDQC